MTTLPKKKYISPEEYLAMERESLERHEYFDGEIFQMAGAGERHNSAGNVSNKSYNPVEKMSF